MPLSKRKTMELKHHQRRKTNFLTPSSLHKRNCWKRIFLSSFSFFWTIETSYHISEMTKSLNILAIKKFRKPL